LDTDEPRIPANPLKTFPMNLKPFSLRRGYAVLALLVQVTGFLQALATPYQEIETAVRNDNVAQIESMISTDGGVKSDTASLCLMVAALWNKQPLAEKLLSQGVSPNASPLYTHEAGETPLIYAIFGAHEKMVKFLLSHGANPNYRGDSRFKDPRGRVPLDLAAKCGFLEIAQLLLDAGADPNAGKSFAVEKANQQGDVKMFQLLLAHGGRMPGQTPKTGATTAAPKDVAAPDRSTLASLGLARLLPRSPESRTKTGNNTRCRLAIIADDANATAADLLTVRLSSQPTLELIERRELERIFAEKQLTRQFAAQDANYNSVAALLRADALLLIRNREIAGTAAVESRFIRVHPGIVLDTFYRAAPVTNDKTWVEETSARTVSLAAKAVRDSATAISMLDVHATLPTPGAVGLERTLTILLRERLVHHPRFIVLERSEMEKVAFENAGEKPFWAASYLADPLLDFALDNSGNFTLALQLQPSGKGTALSAKVSGKRTEPARAIDDLLKAIDQKLGGAGLVPPREVAAEANSYLAEARWAMAAKMPARAATAVEVAWALGLQNLDVARLRVQSAEQAAQSSVSFRLGPEGGSMAETLDYAVQAVGVWDDVLQGPFLRANPSEFKPWIESISALTDAASLAILSVGTATEQIEQADRLAILRKMYLTTLNDALIQTRLVASNTTLPELLSKTQLGSARIMLPEGEELRAALQEILSRHFAVNDAVSHAELLVGLRWYPSVSRRIETYSGPIGITYHYPANMAVREWLLDWLPRSCGAQGRFTASAIDFEGPTILSVEHSTRLMEEFWGMRDELAQDGDLLKSYYQRLHNLIENEPMSSTGYIPRVYQLHLEQDESAEKATQEMTQFEFNRRLYLYLISHASRPQPAFDDLVAKYSYRYTPEQKNELQEADARYTARTGARPIVLSAKQRPVVRRSEPTAPPDVLPSLRITQFWHPFNLGRNISPDFEFHSGSMLWAEDRLWFEGSVQDFEARQMHHYLFAVDPLSMKTEIVELPTIAVAKLVPGPAVEHGVRFVVRPDMLVVAAAHDFLALYDRATQRWQTYPAIQPARLGRPEIIGDVAYLIVEDGNGLISFDLKQRTTKVLASTRRRPAESALDDPALWFSQIFKSPGGDLILIAQSDRTDYLKMKSIAQAWSPATQSWKPIEGPVRSLSDAVTRMAPGRVTGTPFLAQCTLSAVGGATAEGRAAQSGLSLHIRNLPKGFETIPLLASPALAFQLPDSRYGPQNLTIRTCFECPAGYIFPPSPGAGFWFLSRKELESYLQLAQTSGQVSRQ
jgi:hypothetical protein